MRELVAVIVGSIVGTSLRLGLDTLVPHTGEQFPVSTLVINVVGSFVLGLFVARVWPTAPVWLRSGLGAGLVGTFTTFSALALSMVTLARSDQLLLAAVYLAVTLIAGFGAAFLGISVGRRRSRAAAEAAE